MRAPGAKELEARLQDIKAGGVPSDTAEQMALALHARRTYRFILATRLYTAAIAADPSLTSDLEQQVLYRAACSAILAADDQSLDEAKLDDVERAKNYEGRPLHGSRKSWMHGRPIWKARLPSSDPTR